MPAWAWMIPWRSKQGRRLGGSELSAKSGSDSTGGTTCTKTGGRTELNYSTEELLRAQRAISKAEAHGAAGSVRNSVQTAQDSYASLDLWREHSCAHEAAGLSAAGLSAAAGNPELPPDPRAAAAWEYPWPLHRQQRSAASGAARLAALQATLRSFAGNGLRHQPSTSAAGGAPEAEAQGGWGERRGQRISLRSLRS